MARPSSRALGSRRRPISLTPLIDVVFILLIFFVMAGRFSQETRLVLRSSAEPTEDAATPADAPAAPMALVGVDADGALVLAGEPVQPDELAARLPPDAVLVLRLAPALDVETMVSVIDRLRRAGLERLSYLPAAGA